MDKALLAIADEETGSHHGDAHALVTDAGELLASLAQAPSPLPFSFLSKLSRAIAGNMTFAPIERAPAPITAGDLRIHVDRPPAPSPRWALEIQLGECWRAAGTLSLALPLTDLIRLDALVDDDDGEARVIRATALGARAHALLKFVDEARDLEVHICGLMAERRSTSRLPALYELLSGFGGLRSSQIEALLGVSRPGARKILAALDNSGTLSRTKLGGVRLYEVMSPPPSFDAAPASSSPALSNSSAMAEYDAAMADIEQVLARHGVAIPEADE